MAKAQSDAITKAQVDLAAATEARARFEATAEAEEEEDFVD